MNPAVFQHHFRLLVLPLAGLLLSSCSGPMSSDRSEAGTAVPDSVVALIDGEPLTLSEFERQYRRSEATAAGEISDSAEALQDFLRRYVDFRLKVLEAREAGYHEDSSLVAEIGTYREQLARPYLLGQEVIDPLVRQLYERRTSAVDVSHILIRVQPDASPADTLEAFRRISAVRDSILSGADFGEMAMRHSEDPSAQRDPAAAGYRGRLGYFGGGKMVRPFEDRAFTVPEGDVSDVFRSQFGYHVLKVHDRTDMPDPRELAHIMIRPKGPTPADTAAAEQRVDEVSSALADGRPFEDLAREFSDDPNSAGSGGRLGVIAFDQGLPVAMRDSAFALTEPGDVTGPVESPFGTHFVKFLSEQPAGTFDEQYEDLRNTVNRMPRLAESQEAFARSILDSLTFSVDSSLVKAWEGSMAPDSLFRSLTTDGMPAEYADRRIATVGDSVITVRAFADWVTPQTLPRGSTPAARVYGAIDAYLLEYAIAHEVDRLEERDAEFRGTMKEFRDGLVLFRLMEDSVWTAAGRDSLALLAHYRQNRDSYRFGDRTRVVSFTSPSDSVLSAFIDEARMSTAADVFTRFAADSSTTIRSDTTYVEGETGSVYDRVLQLREGELTEPITYNRGFIVLMHAGLDPARVKTFEEARAELVSERQTILEHELLDRLRREYDAVLFPEHLRNAFRQSGTE